MAVTGGHGNPGWTKEETALALELYLALGKKMPSKSDPSVVELSNFLQKLEVHRDAKKNQAFRNTDGVVFKIGNLRAVETGKGLQNTSRMDKVVWEEFGNRPVELTSYCDLIRSGNEFLKAVHEDGEEDSEEPEVSFREGRMLTHLHRRRERHKGLRKKLIAQLKKSDRVECEMCGAKPPEALGEAGLQMFECHHVIPLSHLAENRTKLADLSLLCANCHRLIHVAISQEGRWLSIVDARALLALA